MGAPPGNKNAAGKHHMRDSGTNLVAAHASLATQYKAGVSRSPLPQKTGIGLARTKTRIEVAHAIRTGKGVHPKPVSGTKLKK